MSIYYGRIILSCCLDIDQGTRITTISWLLQKIRSESILMLGFVLIIGLICPSLNDPQRDTQHVDEKLAVMLTSFHVNSRIMFHYCRTVVTAQYKNPGFSINIPESAFISNFSMTIQGEEFVAEVKEAGEAEKSYSSVVSRDVGAGLVSQNMRDSSRFSVDTNLEGGAKVVFTLTYEELGLNITARAKDGLYHSQVDICLGSHDITDIPSCLQPEVSPKKDAQSFLKKLFAFQHIKQILKEKDLAERFLDSIIFPDADVPPTVATECSTELSNSQADLVSLTPGTDYTSVTSLDHLFRAVSSVKKCDIYKIILNSAASFSKEIVGSLLVYWIIPRKLVNN